MITGVRLQLVGVLHTLQRLGLMVGRDVASAAYDDMPIRPAQPAHRRGCTRHLGREAAGLLLALLAHPRKPLRILQLHTEIII